MKTTASDALQKAIEKLGAVEVAPELYDVMGERFATYREADDANASIATMPGVSIVPARYAYRSKANDGGYVTVGRDTLADNAIYADYHGRDELRNMLALYARPMPAWWTPERRFATKCDKCGARFPFEDWDITVEHCPRKVCEDNPTERITADLTTGEEVPA